MLSKLKSILLAVMLGLSTLVVPAAVLAPTNAEAANTLVCSFAVSTGGAVSTASTPACVWGKGVGLLLQCDVNVNMNSSTVNQVLAAATSSHQFVNYVDVPDPLKIQLQSNDQHLSVLGKASGNCSVFRNP